LVSAAASEAILDAAYWTGLAAIFLSATLLAVVAVLRVRLRLAQRRRKALLAVWRHAIALRLAGEAAPLPKLARRDAGEFIGFWNSLHDWLRGDSALRLIAVARELDIPSHAYWLLEHGSLRERVSAAAALGHLREAGAFDAMDRLTHDRRPLLSITAARALVEINPEAAIPRLLPLIVERADWPPARVAGILREAGPAHVSQPLAAAIRDAAPENAATLLRFSDVMRPEDSLPLVRDLLAESRNEYLLAAALRAVRDPRALPQVRALTRHPRWHLRMLAAVALGRFGAAEDATRLVEILGDAQWWVRYRAARTLAHFPGMSAERLHAIQVSHPDRYARDILAQVIAESAAA
jgi:HEAT repeat protein